MTVLSGLNDDFRDLITTLVDADVEFLLIGAFAVAFHGAPRATGDLDVLVRPSEDNARRVFAALARFGAPLSSAELSESDLAQPGVVYQIGVPPRRIDILTKISGVSFDEAWGTRVEVEIESRTAYVIDREALLKNKRASGRSKDLADVERLTSQRG